MAKNTTLSSDVDFIKEFEELKLKQKLLIDSLNKKNITQQNQLFLEINAKLDFLVKIFKDANEADSKAEEEKLEAHFKEVLDKISLVEKGLIEKLELQQSSINSIKTDISDLSTKISTQVLVPVSVQNPPSPSFEIKAKTEVQSLPSKEISVSSTLPVKVEEKKEKKGWFR